MMQILLKGATLADPMERYSGPMDLLIQDEKIARIDRQIDAPADQVVDLGGQVLFPGLVDMHCHLREPGFEYKEDITTGTQAAACGGFAAVACMANTQPVADNEAVVAYIKNRGLQEGRTRVYPIGAVTKGLKGRELAEMGMMRRAGAVAFSDDGMPIMSGRVMRLALEYAANFDALIICHEEDLDILDGGVMNEGVVSAELGLPGANRAAEEAMIARDVLLAESLGVKVHIAHVSTAGGVEIIRQAKNRGVAVTSETCPHYFALTDELVRGYDGNTRVNPPLRTAADVAAIIEGLKDGTIDCIVTDHAPHHVDEKLAEFPLVKSGMIGFETALALGFEYLVEPGHLSLAELADKMSASPARILGIPYGRIAVGAPATLTAADPRLTWVPSRESLHSKSLNTPLLGRTLTGKTTHLWIDGQAIVQEGRLMK